MNIEQYEDVSNSAKSIISKGMLAIAGRYDLKLLENENGNFHTQVDHRFYLALAKGDKAAMESVLNELTSPKIARQRNVEQAFGLTERLIATHATIYAKIAWRHGYEVEVDSPWVPREWLPIRPLDRYDDPWPFMKDFDLYQPFEAGWADWSPVPGDRKLIR